MNVYSNKQRWKRFLLAAAAVIVLATLWYSNDIAQRIRLEEKTKVRLWSEAIVQRAELVGYTQQLFEELGTEERGKADRLADAYRLINDPPRGMDLTFITDYLWSNKTIPVLIYDANDELLYQVNIPEDASLDSLKRVMSAANAPIVFNNVGHTVYWDESVRFSELKDVMQDLINSFISETVINSASVPVVMTDNTRTKVIRYQRVDSTTVADPERLQSLLAGMAGSNEPIEVDLPGEGRHYIYYADSVILTQLRYYPLAQLVLIAVFTFVAYLIFSSFRRAEQDQVWVGMAKETAHQLGTPLSSLMAWVGLLEDQGVRKDYLEEMNRDIVRLNTVVDRFSKIGSKPILKEQNVALVIESTVEYMKPRVSKKVELTFEGSDLDLQSPLSPPLFSWVLENLIRNAVDAMDGDGKIQVALQAGEEGGVLVTVSDTGPGIPKSKRKEIFQPGYTTKPRGWGLGLSLCKRIIEEYHGGRISVEEKSVFLIEFQLKTK
ncbi:HAMP domain-containing sensor histidine kinase [Flavobacteriales bacterium]|jgi:two-component system, sporulation sensor kinase D|nr:HAMP domain-containing sensor histidine kinase [Flavobacteriales bacterium]